jgi:hypothetical protein
MRGLLAPVVASSGRIVVVKCDPSPWREDVRCRGVAVSLEGWGPEDSWQGVPGKLHCPLDHSERVGLSQRSTSPSESSQATLHPPLPLPLQNGAREPYVSREHSPRPRGSASRKRGPCAPCDMAREGIHRRESATHPQEGTCTPSCPTGMGCLLLQSVPPRPVLAPEQSLGATRVGCPQSIHSLGQCIGGTGSHARGLRATGREVEEGEAGRFEEGVSSWSVANGIQGRALVPRHLSCPDQGGMTG